MKYYLAILLILPILASASGFAGARAVNDALPPSAAADRPTAPENAVAFFATNSDKLTSAAVSAITHLIIRSRYSPSIKFALTGHSDAKGSKNHNLLLSMRRANAVRDYMIETGVRPEKIDIYAFGEVRAAINTKHSQELILDRRVVITKLRSETPSVHAIAMKDE